MSLVVGSRWRRGTVEQLWGQRLSTHPLSTGIVFFGSRNLVSLVTGDGDADLADHAQTVLVCRLSGGRFVLFSTSCPVLLVDRDTGRSGLVQRVQTGSYKLGKSVGDNTIVLL